MKPSLRKLVSLQLHGVKSEIGTVRRGGAGPSNTKAFVIGGRCLTLPVANSLSPFEFCTLAEKTCFTLDDGEIDAEAVAKPEFYDLESSEGIPFRKLALLHGKDCLASTVLQQCSRYADPNLRCRFCALGKTLESGDTVIRKTPEQLAEAAEAAKRLDNIKHVTLTSGTTKIRQRGILYLGECASAITERTGLPVQIQFEPPEDFSVFKTLKKMKVANVAMHVESLDENIRRTMTPGKAEIPLHYYFSAFEHAISVFGRNRVGTYVILGLGEDRDLTLKRALQLVEMGVYPNIVPLRPLPGTAMQNAAGPDEEYLCEVYSAVGAAMRKYHMTAEGNIAGCGRCGACSLLQFTQENCSADPVCPQEKEERVDPLSRRLTLEKATSEEDLKACFAIRRKIFCGEQGLFNGDDHDRRDENAVHIIAKVDDEPVGCVRCFERRPGIWVGGRLAVLKKYRSFLGGQLVKKAVETIEATDGARRFFAIVQIQNVRFFKWLRWKPLGHPFFCNGLVHQVMEKPLNGGAVR